jgi:Initiator Replication protein
MDDSVTTRLKTTDVRRHDDEIIKPNELVHIIETKPLTLEARRIYNLLIANAWEKIEEPVVHSIRKSELRGLHSSTDRLIDAIRSLMGTIVETEIERDGKRYVRRVQLLGDNEEELDERGVLNYSFSAGLRNIFKSSFVFAALQRQVMFAFTSRYALVLYEMIQARGKLKFKWSEEFELERFRRLMGVQPDKLVQFKHFNSRVIVPAVTEVTGLSDYNVKITPIKSGKKVTGLRLHWGAKSEEEIKAAFKELRGSKVGRLARLTGKVETMVPDAPRLPATKRVQVVESLPEKEQPTEQDRERGMKAKAKRMFAGLDVEYVYTEFNREIWTGRHPEPKNREAAFISYAKKQAAASNVPRSYTPKKRAALAS